MISSVTDNLKIFLNENIENIIRDFDETMLEKQPYICLTDISKCKIYIAEISNTNTNTFPANLVDFAKLNSLNKSDTIHKYIIKQKFLYNITNIKNFIDGFKKNIPSESEILFSLGPKILHRLLTGSSQITFDMLIKNIQFNDNMTSKYKEHIIRVIKEHVTKSGLEWITLFMIVVTGRSCFPASISDNDKIKLNVYDFVMDDIKIHTCFNRIDFTKNYLEVSSSEQNIETSPLYHFLSMDILNISKNDTSIE
jgi:hypothetical protein